MFHPKQKSIKENKWIIASPQLLGLPRDVSMELIGFAEKKGYLKPALIVLQLPKSKILESILYSP
jgi:hypothetical protein